jgi:hypothetical protein
VRLTTSEIAAIKETADRQFGAATDVWLFGSRLEQLGFVESAAAWQSYRETRNRLTHEYPDAPEIQAAVLNQAWQVADELRDGYRRILGRLENQG